MSTGCYTADCAAYTARKEYSFDAVPHVIVDEVISDLMSVQKKMPKIKQIIINPPATIILWKDGTKTVSKTKAPEVDHITLPDGKELAVVPKDEYDPEVGVAMCIAKKYFGSRNQFTKAVEGAMNDFEGRPWA